MKYPISRKKKILLYDEQDERCAICDKLFKDLSNAHVDHNHLTNKVRKLLCLQCNAGIGFFQENVEYLSQAIKYLIIEGNTHDSKERRDLEWLATKIIEYNDLLPEESRVRFNRNPEKP